MSTRFTGEGNIGSPPEYHEFPSDNDEPHCLIRLNVYLDNSVPLKGGGFEDRGGFWAPIELWHKEARRWSTLLQQGMRVLIDGRLVCDRWVDGEGNNRVTFKIEARRVAVLLHRIDGITMTARPATDIEPDAGQ